MPTTKRQRAWLAFLLWMVPAAALAETRGKLVGKVHDPEGDGIPGVIVTVTSPQIPNFREVVETDKKGVFSIGFSQINVTYHYRFDKAGYQSLEAEQNWRLEGTQLFEWTMQKAKAEEVGGAPPASSSEPAILAYNAGVAAFNSKDYVAAEARFRDAVKEDPNLRQGWSVLSRVEVELGHYQDAVQAAEKAVALGSTDQSVLMARWQAYRGLKDDAKAAEALKDLEKFGKQTEEAKKFHNEAVALVKAKDYAGAFAKFEDALKLDPNLQPSLIGLAEAGLKIGKNAEAAAAAETLLKESPGNEQALRLRFNACLALGDKGKLVDALVGLAPFEPAVARNGLLRLAFEAYDANDLPAAKARFGKVVAIDPNYPLPYYYLAVIEIGQGENAEAKAHLERFLTLAPNDKEADSAREMLKYINKP